jgi:hypothetical protein
VIRTQSDVFELLDAVRAVDDIDAIRKGVELMLPHPVGRPETQRTYRTPPAASAWREADLRESTRGVTGRPGDHA